MYCGAVGLAPQACGATQMRTSMAWPSLMLRVCRAVLSLEPGPGRNYGLVRYWWVAIKLASNLILNTLIVTALRSEVAKAAGVLIL
jgi:hypothetical protein